MRAAIPLARIPILLAKCCGVCIVVGSLVGGIGVGLVMELAGTIGITPYKEPPSLRNVLMSPLMAFFALPMTGPFGGLSGALATLVVLTISRCNIHPMRRAALVLLGAATGFLLGILFPMFLHRVLGFSNDPRSMAILASLGAAAAATSGALIGRIAWSEFQRATVEPQRDTLESFHHPPGGSEL
jgi:hypothetical protein